MRCMNEHLDLHCFPFSLFNQLYQHVQTSVQQYHSLVLNIIEHPFNLDQFGCMLLDNFVKNLKKKLCLISRTEANICSEIIKESNKSP